MDVFKVIDNEKEKPLYSAHVKLTDDSVEIRDQVDNKLLCVLSKSEVQKVIVSLLKF